MSAVRGVAYLSKMGVSGGIEFLCPVLMSFRTHSISQSAVHVTMAAQGILKQGFLVKKVSEKRRTLACRPFYRVVARCFIIINATGLPHLAAVVAGKALRSLIYSCVRNGPCFAQSCPDRPSLVNCFLVCGNFTR